MRIKILNPPSNPPFPLAAEIAAYLFREVTVYENKKTSLIIDIRDGNATDVAELRHVGLSVEVLA